jgi:hypothetical protein
MDHGDMNHEGMDHEDEASGGSVVVIDLESGEIIAVIPMGPNATGIGAAAPR